MLFIIFYRTLNFLVRKTLYDSIGCSKNNQNYQLETYLILIILMVKKSII